MTPNQLERISMAMRVFTPRQAIKSSEHLAGRNVEINKLISAIFEPGGHAVVYGDRGVGKTSIANCVAESMAGATSGGSLPLTLSPVNCDSADSFTSVWKKVLSRIDLTETSEILGFSRNIVEELVPLLDHLPDTLTPFDIQGALQHLGEKSGVVVMLDEFDRLQQGEVTRLIADTLKGLSDQDIPATVVAVGVGESVTELIRGHESITRHLIEVSVPRISFEERKKIVNDRLPELGLKAEADALNLIAGMSRGLPYYVHLLGQKSAITAISSDSKSITRDHTVSSIALAVSESDRALRDAYYAATRSSRPDNKYPHTLVACALAHCDDFGYFAPKDVAPMLSKIVGSERSPGSFVDRLQRFASEDRGNILISSGKKYDRRFRFRDPLVQPFVVMKSIESNLISVDEFMKD